MAKRAIIVSDLSGAEVTEENGAKVTISYPGRDTTRILDVTAAEADEMLAGGREVKKRGRKSASNGNAAPAATTGKK